MTQRFFETGRRAYDMPMPVGPSLIEFKTGSALLVEHLQAASALSGAAVHVATGSVAKLADAPGRWATA